MYVRLARRAGRTDLQAAVHCLSGTILTGSSWPLFHASYCSNECDRHAPHLTVHQLYFCIKKATSDLTKLILILFFKVKEVFLPLNIEFRCWICRIRSSAKLSTNRVFSIYCFSV